MISKNVLVDREGEIDYLFNLYSHKYTQMQSHIPHHLQKRNENLWLDLRRNDAVNRSLQNV